MTTISGYAAVFGSLSEPLGGPYGFRERIRYGAFREALGVSDVRALFNHDANWVLARTSSGTLSLTETPQGLLAEFTLPDTQTIRDLVLAPIERRDVSAWSFGFTVAEGGERWSEENGQDIRELTRIGRLFDVSLVTFPAYPGTDGINLRGQSIARWTAPVATPPAAPTRTTAGRITTGRELGEFILRRQQRWLTVLGGG